MADTTAGAEMPEGLVGMINSFGVEFDTMCELRHNMGAEKYGPGKFLTVDTMEEALFELVDLSNYAKYTYARIRLLQERLKQLGAPDFAKTLDPNA